MTLKKVASGQSFRPRADDWNAFVDAAMDYRQRRNSFGARSMPGSYRQGIVLVRNKTGADQDQFSALWIDDLAIRPDDPDGEQRFRTLAPVFDLKLFTDIAAANRHECRYVVIQEPLKDGKVGHGMLFGVSPAKLDIPVEAHDYAEPNPTLTAKLRSGWSGSCRILWKQAGTGEKWALVHFPVSDAPRLLIENASGETILDGYACMVSASAGEPWKVQVTKPDEDSRLQTIAYSGPDLPDGETAALRIGEVMRFRVDTGSLSPGDFIGTKNGAWSLTANRFGFLVLGTEYTGGAYYAYVRYSGVPPVLKAVSDENTSTHTISVRHVDSDGATAGSSFTLDVIPEA
jgi:hypothetical protein